MPRRTLLVVLPLVVLAGVVSEQGKSLPDPCTAGAANATLVAGRGAVQATGLAPLPFQPVTSCDSFLVDVQLSSFTAVPPKVAMPNPPLYAYGYITEGFLDEALPTKRSACLRVAYFVRVYSKPLHGTSPFRRIFQRTLHAYVPHSTLTHCAIDTDVLSGGIEAFERNARTAMVYRYAVAVDFGTVRRRVGVKWRLDVEPT